MEIENKYNELARKIFADIIYCTIATPTSSGEPWISPMYFRYHNNYNIYWISVKDCKHSKLIEQNPRLAITIFDSHAKEGTGNAVYIVAKASEVNTEELPHALSIMYSQKNKTRSPAEFQGDCPRRVYKAVPIKI